MKYYITFGDELSARPWNCSESRRLDNSIEYRQRLARIQLPIAMVDDSDDNYNDDDDVAGLLPLNMGARIFPPSECVRS